MQASDAARPVLCLVTSRVASRLPVPEAVRAAVPAGVDWIQVRERELPGAALLAHADAIVEAARRGAEEAGGEVRVLVNRFLDVALAVGADGVHLGGDALGVAAARTLLPAAASIGVSAHAVAELAPAARAGASYAHLAPILPPLSKAPSRPALGLEVLREARRSGLPVLAQGGITAGNAADALRAGAAGVAVTASILAADDPAEAAAALRRALDAAAA